MEENILVSKVKQADSLNQVADKSGISSKGMSKYNISNFIQETAEKFKLH